jgi:nucleoside transporter
MFLQYFVWGCWYVTMSTYLGQTLGFSGTEIGLAYSTLAISAMIAPFFVGLIADKYFALERVLGVLHLIGAVLLYFVAQADSFWTFFTLIFLYNLCYTPTIALSNSFSFSQMQNPGTQFPGVRVLGTIGWIASGLLVGWLAIEAQAIFFVLAAGFSLVLGLYCFTLPHVPPKPKEDVVTDASKLIGLDALKLMKDKSFAILIISSFLISIPLMFYYSFANLFLNELGLNNAAGKMTMGQMSEILFLILMPFFFRHLGVKKMILIGMAAWIARYLLFALGDVGPLSWMLYAGIILHGICYDFFFVTGQIFVDKRAPAKLRSSAQGLITFATYGVGFFVGTLLSGYTVDAFAVSQVQHQWHYIWLVPAALAGLVTVFFAAFFHSKE